MSPRVWIEFWLNNGTAWYFTYLGFSTVVLGVVPSLVRGFRAPPKVENLLWRAALVASPLLALGRITIEHLDNAEVQAGRTLLSVSGRVGEVMSSAVVLAMIVAGLLALRLGRGLVRERAQLSRRNTVHCGWIHEELASVAREMRCPLPRLTTSHSIAAPIALGTGKRREICLPEGSVVRLGREEARAVLAHELDHLRRADAGWTAVAHVFQQIFFLQPLHRIATRRLRETAEFRADESAVCHTGDPEHLVQALVSFARASRGSGVLATGFAPSSLLRRRVERLLMPSPPAARFPAPGLLLLVLLLVLTAAVWFIPAIVPACDCRWHGLL